MPGLLSDSGSDAYDSDASDPLLDDDDDMALDVKSVLNKGKEKADQLSYESLSLEDILARAEQEVDDVASILGVEHAIASIILLHFRWNKERLVDDYMDSPSAVLRAIGEPEALLAPCTDPPSKRARLEPPAARFACGVCCDTYAEDAARALRCRHRFCAHCWGAHVASRVKDEGQCVVQCMEEGCSTVVDRSFIRNVVDDACFERYQTLVLQHYVSSKADFRFCPHPSCSSTVYCQGARGSSLLMYVPTVRCAAGHTFCFGCGLDASHRPVICQIAAKWNNAKDDSGTYQWIKANTRTCPNCQNSIEKSGGCNRMGCRHCKHQFCWMCMKAWSVHGYNDSVCNAFVEPEPDAHMSAAAVNLERWLFYFDRFNNHELSARLDEELCRNMAAKVLEIQESSNLSWIEATFMQKAVDELTKCRATLKWTYAMAHFLAKGNKKQIFEDIQADLERAVEQLSQLLNDPIAEDTIKELRQRVTDKTVYVQKRHEIMLDDVATGLAEGKWEWTVSLE